jgi:site-specific DNA-methyltransferase (adenine-specific)
MKLDQYFTPTWAAELLVKRHFPELRPGDVVTEPSCGDGRFLMAIPENVDAYGVEIDPDMASLAVANSGREVIVGDFCTVDLPRRPTVVIGNPPFQASLVDSFLDRCYEQLEYEGRVGFLLPVYMFQTAGTVMRYSRRWSLAQELVPRNLFERITKPLMFATFTKERKTVMSGLFLYREVHALESLKREFRELFVGNGSKAGVWRETVYAALRICGGQATLPQIYACIENNRPTDNPHWREKIRQIAGAHFERVKPGEYKLREAA